MTLVRHRGAVNGIAMSVSGLARAIAPGIIFCKFKMHPFYDLFYKLINLFL